MERKHVVLSKDGMKVEVKEVKDEAYKDRTQRFVCPELYRGLGPFGLRVLLICVLGSVLVNMWNHTSFPNYKSRLWDMTGSSSSAEQDGGAEKRKAYVPTSVFGLMADFL